MTAWLLKKAGYEVHGMILRLWESEGETERPWTERTCCHVPMVDYLCTNILRIPHEIHESAQSFQEKVIAPFKEGYKSARTPNPCTTCNAEIKIRTLLNLAKERNIPAIATGHYASWAKSSDYGTEGLRIGRDRGKDQSYFLARTEGITSRNLLLPLGDLTKEEVRSMAESAGFPVSGMLENQEACFISEKRIGPFLVPLTDSSDPLPWKALSPEGNLLGTMRTGLGLTRGQRRGHGIAGGERLYVLSVNPGLREVILGQREDLFASHFEIQDPLGKIRDPLPEERPLSVRLRSTMAPVQCRMDRSVRTRFHLDTPHDGIVSGQVAAFYDRDEILIGSGIIA